MLRSGDPGARGGRTPNSARQRDAYADVRICTVSRYGRNVIADLNSYSKRFAEALFTELPQFRENARRDDRPQVDDGSLIVEYRPPPEREESLFWLSTYGEEITIGFGEFHDHFEWPEPDHDPIGFIRDLMADRLVIVDKMRGKTWRGSTTLSPNEEPDVAKLGWREVYHVRSWSGRLDRVVSRSSKPG